MGMVHDKEVERVKLVGPLWTTKLVLSIIRDVLFIVFLIVAIVGVIFLVSSLSGVLSGVGGAGGVVGGIGSLLDLPNTLQTMAQGGPEALLAGFIQDVENNNWEDAEMKVNQFELLVQQEGSSEGLYLMSQLKQAVKQHNKQKIYEILAQAKDLDSQNR